MDPVLITTTTALLSAVVAGLFAALHAAGWGAFKDGPFEGFRWRSYARSFVLAGALAVLLAFWVAPTAPGVVVLVGATYALERLVTEWWKSIVRDNDQAAYTIPMRLGLFGRPVQSRAVRYAVGAAIGTIVAGGLIGLHLLQVAAPDLAPPSSWLVAVAVGSVGGWATAIGGAWKDAPVEGFSSWKFLRSPAVAAAWAVPLAGMSQSWPALLLASAGFAVVSIETYKTFFAGGRPPGKFAGKQVLAALPRARSLLVVQSALWWVVLAVLLARAAVALTADGLLLAASAGAALVAAAVGRRGLAGVRPVGLATPA